MSHKSFFSIWICLFSASVMLAAGCDNSVDFNNSPPSGLAIDKDKCYIAPSAAMSLCGLAEDSDEDSLYYSWTASGGTFIPASGEGKCVTWEAPGASGNYLITLKVSDRIDDRTVSTEIEVGEELFIQPGLTELDRTDTYYIVSKKFPVRVLSGTTLRISKGVKVVFVDRDGGLQIEGTMEAQGTPTEPVVFTSAECNSEDGVWGGIIFTGASSSGTLSNVNISTAVTGVKATGGATVVMDSCSVVDGSGRGIIAEDNSNVSLTRCKIWENSGGCEISESYFRVNDSSIRYNTNYGFYLQNSDGGNLDFAITSSTVANNTGDGFLLSGYADPVINGNAIFLNENGGGTAYNIRLYLYYADITIDATGNYWGVLSDNAIAATILDGADNPAIDTEVDFSGWLNESPAGW